MCGLFFLLFSNVQTETTNPSHPPLHTTPEKRESTTTQYECPQRSEDDFRWLYSRKKIDAASKSIKHSSNSRHTYTHTPVHVHHPIEISLFVSVKCRELFLRDLFFFLAKFPFPKYLPEIRIRAHPVPRASERCICKIQHCLRFDFWTCFFNRNGKSFYTRFMCMCAVLSRTKKGKVDRRTDQSTD